MSKEQLTDQQTEVGVVAQNTTAVAQTQGLPPHIYARVVALGPADSPALTDLLILYPGFTPRILAAAAPLVGNAAVQRAISMAQQRRSVQGRAGSMNHDAMSAALGDSPAQPAQRPLSHAEYPEYFEDSPPVAAQPAQLPLRHAEFPEYLEDESEAPKGPEPAWSIAARKYNVAHGGLVAEFNAATNFTCVGADGRPDPLAIAAWQDAHNIKADGKVGPQTVETARHKETEEAPAPAPAHGGAEKAMAEEETWKPSTAKKTDTLAGTYGEYKVKHGFAYDAIDGWSYEVELTMTANEKATAEKIGWIQTVRRSKGSGGGWASGKDDQGMTDERAKRTDDKTGFRVDRASAPDKKTPFYGMDKGSDGKLSAASNTKVGKHGGTNAYLYDGPGLYDKDELEFVSTATDMATGAQYDAVHWGCKYDKAGKVATETTPALIKAGDELLAGRDRAINKWNTDIAKGDIDKVPTTADPAATARTLSGQLGGTGVDEAGVTTSLKAVTDEDLRKRIQACYKVETGRSLADDLKTKLSKDALTGLDAWL